jgi:hypothetical protein
MRPLYPLNPEQCLPMRVGKGPSEQGARLGGRAPVDVAPRRQNALSSYFATVPLTLEPTLEVSLFLSLDFDSMADAAGRLLHKELIEPVIHQPTRRGTSDWLTSSLPEHPLIIMEQTEDWVVEGKERIILPGHKLGGRPYTIRKTQTLLAELQECNAQGFTQVLQLDFPVGADDATVAGDWPFADGMFHLLGRPPFASGDWRWFWEF